MHVREMQCSGRLSHFGHNKRSDVLPEFKDSAVSGQNRTDYEKRETSSICFNGKARLDDGHEA